MNIKPPEFQHSFQTYFENCVINNLARAELADIREAIEILDKNDILFKNRHISMAFIIRIGSVIENGLREFYMAKRGLNSIQELKQTDDIFRLNVIFQRLKQREDGRDAISIFNKIGISITDNIHYKKIAEILEHRHLYAHNSGFVDDKYIFKIIEITGEDIRGKLTQYGYPEKDVQWLRPLNKITEYASVVEEFLNTLT